MGTKKLEWEQAGYRVSAGGREYNDKTGKYEPVPAGVVYEEVKAYARSYSYRLNGGEWKTGSTYPRKKMLFTTKEEAVAYHLAEVRGKLEGVTEDLTEAYTDVRIAEGLLKELGFGNGIITHYQAMHAAQDEARCEDRDRRVAREEAEREKAMLKKLEPLQIGVRVEKGLHQKKRGVVVGLPARRGSALYLGYEIPILWDGETEPVKEEAGNSWLKVVPITTEVEHGY